MTRLRRFLLRHVRSIVWLAVGGWLSAIAVGIATGLRPKPWWMAGLFAVVVASVFLAAWARWQRQQTIREGSLPQFLKRKLREWNPDLDGRDCDLIERGFRQFFLACLRSDGKFVAMPSKAVDAFWHEFILHTRAYRDWCDLTLGRFLHHTPAEVLGPKVPINDGLRRAWFWSCREESIRPRSPTRLPLLFALDGKLRIAGGFVYATDCSGLIAGAAERAGGVVHCGADFGSDGFSGDAEGMGGVDVGDGGSGDGGDGGGDGGCGGD